MNNTKIEWCDRSWNPVTGCVHDCPYCYARNIARRFGGNGGCFVRDYGRDGLHEIDVPTKIENCPGKKDKTFPYPFGFEPTFHRYKLEEPQMIKKPQNIFVGSMTDLFGYSIPVGWIKQVFEACKASPIHRYLFLTKCPSRYMKINDILPNEDNFWYGTSITKPDTPYFGSAYNKTFLSIEPLLEPFNQDFEIMVDWVIIGAETGNRKGKVVPRREWIESIVEKCRERNIPVFMKNSLAKIWWLPLIQEFPWV